MRINHVIRPAPHFVVSFTHIVKSFPPSGYIVITILVHTTELRILTGRGLLLNELETKFATLNSGSL